MAGGVEAHLIEVKTLCDNDKNQINMHPPSMRKKEAYVSKAQCVGHTIAIEGRTEWEGGSKLHQAEEVKRKYGGRLPIAYYRRGFQGYRLSAAMPIFAWEELVKVMSMPLDELAVEAILNPLYKKAMPSNRYAKITDESETTRTKAWKVKLKKSGGAK